MFFAAKREIDKFEGMFVEGWAGKFGNGGSWCEFIKSEGKAGQSGAGAAKREFIKSEGMFVWTAGLASRALEEHGWAGNSDVGAAKREVKKYEGMFVECWADKFGGGVAKKQKAKKMKKAKAGKSSSCGSPSAGPSESRATLRDSGSRMWSDDERGSIGSLGSVDSQV